MIKDRLIIGNARRCLGINQPRARFDQGRLEVANLPLVLRGSAAQLDQAFRSGGVALG